MSGPPPIIHRINPWKPGLPRKLDLEHALKAARDVFGHSQQELANRLHCNVQTISRWESGGRYPYPFRERQLLFYIESANRRIARMRREVEEELAAGQSSSP